MPRIIRRAPDRAQPPTLALKHVDAGTEVCTEKKKSISVASSAASPFQCSTQRATKKTGVTILPYVLVQDYALREKIRWVRTEGHSDLWLPAPKGWQTICDREDPADAPRKLGQDDGCQSSSEHRPTIGFSNDGTWVELDEDGKTWAPMQRLPAFLVPEVGTPDAPANVAPQVGASPAKPRQPNDFGIPAHRVKDCLEKQQAEFDLLFGATLKRQYRVKHSPDYERVPRNYTKADGSQGTEYIYVRKKDALTRGMRFNQFQIKLGREIEKKAKAAARIARQLSGCPRKTGSTYADDTPKEDLLNNRKQEPFDNAFAVQSALKLGSTISYGATVLASPGDAAEVGLMTDLLSGTSEIQAPFDAMFAGEAVLRSVFVAREENKAKLGHFTNAARARAYAASSTSEEARANLTFMEGATALFHTPQDLEAIQKAAWGRFVRMGILQPIASSASLAVEVANSLDKVPFAGPAMLGPTTLTNICDCFEARNEFLRFALQVEKADARKRAMEELLMDAEVIKHPEYSLLKGIAESLIALQEQLIKRGETEMIFALVHALKGGAVIGANVAVLAATLGVGIALGAATLAATGPFGAIPAAVMLAIWSAALAARNEARVEDLHRSKWDKRAMIDARYDGLTREGLEQKLSSGEADDRMVTVHQQEGEYLPKKAKFAGDRVIKFDVRDNVYAGLEGLAYKIQDIVKEANYDASNPFVKLVHANKMNEFELLMVCKAVSDTKVDIVQRDAIESHLAKKVGAAARAQAAPHVSLFIEQFRDEWDEVDRRLPLNAGVADQQPRFFEAVRARLLVRYGHDEARLREFIKTVGEFLSKTKGLSRHNVRAADGYLEKFIEYLGSSPSQAPGAAPMQPVATVAQASPPEQPVAAQSADRSDLLGGMPTSSNGGPDPQSSDRPLQRRAPRRVVASPNGRARARLAGERPPQYPEATEPSPARIGVSVGPEVPASSHELGLRAAPPARVQESVAGRRQQGPAEPTPPQHLRATGPSSARVGPSFGPQAQARAPLVRLREAVGPIPDDVSDDVRAMLEEVDAMDKAIAAEREKKSLPPNNHSVAAKPQQKPAALPSSSEPEMNKFDLARQQIAERDQARKERIESRFRYATTNATGMRRNPFERAK